VLLHNNCDDEILWGNRRGIWQSLPSGCVCCSNPGLVGEMVQGKSPIERQVRSKEDEAGATALTVARMANG
jgi:hypothetical protein